MSDESIKPPTKSNKILNPSLDYVGTKTRVKCNGNCLKQEKIAFNHGKIVKHLHCLWNRKKCWYKQLYNTGKLFI